MLKAIGFGLAVGAGVQAWRNVPPDGPLSGDSAVLVMVLAVLCAYLGGRWHGRGRYGATAVAVASAEATATAAATNSVQLAIMLGRDHETVRPHGVTVPDEAVAWFNGERVQVSADDVDGMDLGELLESQRDGVPDG